MKITIQDEGLTVSIENNLEVSTAWDARELCISALLGMTYLEETVAMVFPSEEDVEEAIIEGVKESLEYVAGSI